MNTTEDKKHLYILLTKTSSIFSFIISKFKGDSFTHSALALDIQLEQMYSFGRKKVHNPFLGGFTEEKTYTGVYMFSKYVPSVVLELDVTTEQYNGVKSSIEEFINNKTKYKYNYRTLFNHVFSSTKKAKNRFVCSEFVYFILHKNGILNIPMPIASIRPVTFLNGVADRVIYQGNLHNYRNFCLSYQKK